MLCLYFPLFLNANVLVQFFMKSLTPNILGCNISVRVKYVQECIAVVKERLVRPEKCEVSIMEAHEKLSVQEDLD